MSFMQKFMTARAVFAGFVGAALALVNHFHTVDVSAIADKSMTVFDVIMTVVSGLVTLGIVGSAHGAKPPEKKSGSASSVMIVLMALGVSGCTGGGFLQQLANGGLSGLVQQYGPGVVSAAQVLCAERVAEQRGISIEEAVEGTCSAMDAIEPLIPIILDARAGVRARMMERQ